jgi:hypothetical protein
VTSGPTLGNAQGGPHSLVHLNLAAFMSNFEVAAFDPVFYAHHTNVDRFWCAWLKHYQGTPGFDAVFPDEDWYFYDIQQGVVRVNVRKWKDFFMDPRNLGYEYDPPAHVFLYDFDVVRLKQNGNGLSVDLASLFVFLNKIILVENNSCGACFIWRKTYQHCWPASCSGSRTWCFRCVWRCKPLALIPDSITRLALPDPISRTMSG